MTESALFPSCSFLDPSLLAWKIPHTFCFALGGLTFVAGTACYFDSIAAYDLAAWLYIVGSCGFLGVDVLEFLTFYRQDRLLTINISLSLVGSTLYIIGSVGFLPSLANSDGSTSAVGIWGFILGSFFIGSSQVWKVLRIGGSLPPAADRHAGTVSLVNEDRQDDDGDNGGGGGEENPDEWDEDDLPWGVKSTKSQQPSGNPCVRFKVSNLFTGSDNSSSFGVEFSACLGGWCFFFGTILDDIGTPSGGYLTFILAVWIFGSVFFSFGSFFLAYRHFILKL